MTRLQRWGLAVLLGEVLLLQAAQTEVLAHFTPLHVPVASVVMFLAGATFGVLALASGGKDEV